MSFRVLVSALLDDLSSEGEQVLAARQQTRHVEAQLGRGLIHTHLAQTER